MKKQIFLSLIAMALFTAFKLTDKPDPLLGRWEFKSVYQGKPFSLVIAFGTNKKYEGFMDKKHFVSGTYHLKHDTLYVADNNCDSTYTGTYKLKFMGQADSVLLKVIQDTCRRRREGSDGVTFKRMKTSPNKL